jgi:hypothetical protein
VIIMALMDSPVRRGAERDRAAERAELAANPKLSTKRRVSLTALLSPQELEEFKRLVAPVKPTRAVTAMVRAFLEGKR